MKILLKKAGEKVAPAYHTHKSGACRDWQNSDFLGNHELPKHLRDCESPCRYLREDTWVLRDVYDFPLNEEESLQQERQKLSEFERQLAEALDNAVNVYGY